MKHQALPGRVASGIASLTTLLALVAVVPLALWAIAGWPLPDHLPSLAEVGRALSHKNIPDTALMKVIALLGWTAWLQIAASITVELGAWLRGRPASRLRFAGPLQPAIRALIASAALLLSSPATRPAVASPLRPHVARIATQATTATPLAVHARTTESTPEAERVEPTYRVVRGDTLWGIAEHHLGDPYRWPEIYEANRTTIQADGRTLEDPDLIIPGWILTLPVDASGAGGHPESSPPVAPIPATAPTPSPTSVPPPSTTPPSTMPPTTVPVPATTNGTNGSAVRPNGQHADKDRSTHSPNIPILVFGGGIVAAGLVALLNRLRRAQQRRRSPGSRPHLPEPALERVEQTLRRAADLDAAEFLDLALRAFAAGATGAGAPMPPVLACRAGREQVELLLASNPGHPPPGFEPTSDERGWMTDPDLDADDLRELAADSTAPLPSLVSIGTLEDEELLIDIESAGVLTIDGDPDQVCGLVRAIATQLATGTWIDHVDVLIAGSAAALGVAGAARVRHVAEIEDALQDLDATARAFARALETAKCGTTLAARLSDQQNDGWIPTILVCNDTTDEHALGRLRSITSSGGRGVGAIARSAQHAPWHAEVRGNELLLSPLGLRIRPHVIDEATSHAVDELLADAATSETHQPDEIAHVASAAVVPSSPYSDPPFELEVRLLGAVEIDGLTSPMNRPQCVEVTAYLALHPKGVSDDRLKTALWPEGAPTLSTFNTIVSMTRVKLGCASDGNHHLPHYQASGQLYRLSPHVTTDIARFEARVAYARQCQPPDAIAALRSALELVRGQPFEATRGFEWSFSEGFVANSEAMVADAAHTLAQLYLDAGDPIGASWAAAQGLKASTGDETLYRDRMLAYDLAGNPAGVERVMDELCEVVEALEPYDTLHPETLTLYERISHRKRARTHANERS